MHTKNQKQANRIKRILLALPLSILFILCLMLITPIVSANLEFFSERIIVANTTNQIQDHLVLIYVSKDIQDYIEAGNPLEAFITYSIYPFDWNLANPSYFADWCNLTIFYSSAIENQSQIIYNELLTSQDTNVFSKKFFVRINQNDGVVADIICKFPLSVPETLDIPATMTISTPTWECKSCQMYEWEKDYIYSIKTKSLGQKTTTIIDYIRQFINQQYEIILAVFWLVSILLLFSVIGLIFIALFWLYLYLMRLAR